MCCYESCDNQKKNIVLPQASDIYISTKTKIVYLNIKDINIYEIFWNIDILDYNIQTEGIIKKQIKLSLPNKEESIKLDEKLKKINNIKIKIINKLENNMINDVGKYKDIRKISIGLSKKELTIKRCKEKSAFYNCFVLTLRIKNNEIFKEFHIKVFNTGKLEIPGIQDDEILYKIINYITYTIGNILNINISYNNNVCWSTICFFRRYLPWRLQSRNSFLWNASNYLGNCKCNNLYYFICFACLVFNFSI